MGQSFIWGVVQFSVIFLEFVMSCFIAHAVLKQKPTLNYKIIALVIIATLIVAPLYLLDLYVLRIASALFHLLLIKYISRRNFGDILIILGLNYALVSIVQLPIAAIIWSSYEMLNFYRPFAFLAMQLPTAVAVVFICKKFKLHQWFHALRMNLALRLVLLVSVLIFLVIASIITFEFQLTHILFFTLAIALVLTALFPVLIKLFHYSLNIISVHDLHNSLLSAVTVTFDMDDVEEVKRIFYKFAKDFGIDAKHLDKELMQQNIDQTKANEYKIEAYIQSKQRARETGVQVISEIVYPSNHNAIDPALALTWLGILLDNALDASVNNPIIVEFFCTCDDFKLEVSNEYAGESQNIQLFFERGYSTKDAGRGIGLHNLYTQVTELGGTVEVSTMSADAFNCQYLSICINFRHDPFAEMSKKQKESKKG